MKSRLFLFVLLTRFMHSFIRKFCYNRDIEGRGQGDCMCGRYFINGDSEAAVLRLIRNGGHPLRRRQGDIRPSEMAPVLVRAEGSMDESDMRWGFLSPKGKGLLINARSETALQKPSFSESVLRRRCIIPAAGFYEWDRQKAQYSFFLPEQPVIYMAGCFRRYEDGDRFTILTTAANESMADIHDRMPLILPERDLDDWLYEDGRTAEFLRKGSALLSKRLTYPDKETYEQLTLPGLFM